MTPTRASFLAAGASAVAAGTSAALAAAAPDRSYGGDVRGLTLTTIRDGGVDHVGIRIARGVVDVAVAAEALAVSNPPRTVDDVLAGRGNVSALGRIAANAPLAAIRSEGAVEFGPLVSSPPKIICVGLNYRAHLLETKLKPPPYPDLFNKYNTALNRHRGTVRVSGLPLTHFDYESELVMYVGKTARNVSEADALDYIFGYSCGHDFTARDAQLRVSQWMTGKTPDEFAPLGPGALANAIRVPPRAALSIAVARWPARAAFLVRSQRRRPRESPPCFGRLPANENPNVWLRPSATAPSEVAPDERRPVAAGERLRDDHASGHTTCTEERPVC